MEFVSFFSRNYFFIWPFFIRLESNYVLKRLNTNAGICIYTIIILIIIIHLSIHPCACMFVDKG